jgi:hypothetical protein
MGSFGWDLLQQQKFLEAETVTRQCTAIREKKFPDDWKTFSTQWLLGSSLVGLKKYAEAEPLLSASYRGMQERKGKISAAEKKFVRQSLQYIIQLYHDRGKLEQEAKWRRELKAQGL